MILAKEFVTNSSRHEKGAMTPSLPCNLNNYARVRPTAAGRAILEAEPFGHMLKVEPDGALGGRLWQVMLTFGPYMAAHLPPPIDEDIEIAWHVPEDEGP